MTDDVRNLRERLEYLDEAIKCAEEVPPGCGRAVVLNMQVAKWIQGALAALERGQVPREPTEAMIDIGRHFIGPRERVAAFWTAMYDAATAERAREDQSDAGMPKNASTDAAPEGGSISASDPQSSLDSPPAVGSGPSQEGARRASSDGPVVIARNRQMDGSYVESSSADPSQRASSEGQTLQEALLREANMIVNVYDRPSVQSLVRDLARELRAALADAERYRWLRDNHYDHCDSGQPFIAVHKQNDWGKWRDDLTLRTEALDSAIDAARDGK